MMSLFFTTYRVEHKKGTFVTNWVPVIKNISLNKANQYIENKTHGLFFESKAHYRIIEE